MNENSEKSENDEKRYWGKTTIMRRTGHERDTTAVLHGVLYVPVLYVLVLYSV